MVLIAVIQQLNAIHNSFVEGGVVGDAVVLITTLVQKDGTVGFDIGLADEIKAVAVAQLHHPRRTGIVAGANGIYVMLFHKAQVGYHLLAADSRAGEGIAVVAVDTVERDVLTVDVQHAVFHGYLAQADRNTNTFVCGFHGEGVQIRMLGVPQNR